MSILTTAKEELVEFLESAWAKLKGGVSSEVKAAENAAIVFYKDLLASTAAHGSEYVAALEDSAKAGVASAATMVGVSGAVKAAAAFTSAATVLASKSFPIIENDIKGAVEAAYASFVQATVAVPAPLTV